MWHLATNSRYLKKLCFYVLVFIVTSLVNCLAQEKMSSIKGNVLKPYQGLAQASQYDQNVCFAAKGVLTMFNKHKYYPHSLYTTHSLRVYACGSISFTFGTNRGINDIIVCDTFHTLFMSFYMYKIMKIDCNYS